MDESRGALASLTIGQRGVLSTVLEMIAADEHAPTTIRDPEHAARLHLADSLAALELERVRDARTIVDIGSGAGFPGLPLAVALPDSHVSLVESQGRKCDFLDGICAGAGIENAEIIRARAEEWSAGAGRADVVVARAVAAQPVVLEYAAPLLRVGGALVDWRGRRTPEEEEWADRAAAILGMRREEVHRPTPVAGAEEHHLHVFVKVAETPERFPRRAGIARKRPLGKPPSADRR
ncbi:MAG: 16S rRNA (guanine(527)-N(7))-methyltransferase RsmG [Solirubrobacteraceae bacterium]